MYGIQCLETLSKYKIHKIAIQLQRNVNAVFTVVNSGAISDGEGGGLTYPFLKTEKVL